MIELDKTGWYPGTVKPARSGWYQRMDTVYGGVVRNYFNGHSWWWHIGAGGQCLINDYKWRGLTKPHCKNCATEMTLGKAIAQTFTGYPDFPGDKYPCTVSPGGKGKLIDCYKCPSCGWSITK